MWPQCNSIPEFVPEYEEFTQLRESLEEGIRIRHLAFVHDGINRPFKVADEYHNIFKCKVRYIYFDKDRVQEQHLTGVTASYSRPQSHYGKLRQSINQINEHFTLAEFWQSFASAQAFFDNLRLAESLYNRLKQVVFTDKRPSSLIGDQDWALSELNAFREQIVKDKKIWSLYTTKFESWKCNAPDSTTIGSYRHVFTQKKYTWNDFSDNCFFYDMATFYNMLIHEVKIELVNGVTKYSFDINSYRKSFTGEELRLEFDKYLKLSNHISFTNVPPALHVYHKDLKLLARSFEQILDEETRGVEGVAFSNLEYARYEANLKAAMLVLDRLQQLEVPVSHTQSIQKAVDIVRKFTSLRLTSEQREAITALNVAKIRRIFGLSVKPEPQVPPRQESAFQPQASQPSELDRLKNTLGLTNKGLPSEQELHSAWKKQCFEHHPDKHPNDPKAKEKFQQKQQAHEKLLQMIPKKP